MAKYLLILICGLVSLFLLGWGYGTNTSTTGFGSINIIIYIGWFMLVTTIFAGIFAAFHR